MTPCPKCGLEFQRTAKRVAIGDYKCSRCRNALNYLRRKARPDEKKKMLARVYTRRAVKLGKLKRLPCEVCGDPKVEAHHDDYDKIMDVRWFCREHHQAHHRALKQAA